MWSKGNEAQLEKNFVAIEKESFENGASDEPFLQAKIDECILGLYKM